MILIISVLIGSFTFLGSIYLLKTSDNWAIALSAPIAGLLVLLLSIVFGGAFQLGIEKIKTNQTNNKPIIIILLLVIAFFLYLVVRGTLRSL